MDALLDRAYQTHKTHGAHRGMNYVECATCRFHVHAHNLPPTGDYLVKHWDTPESYDREFITSLDDPRINPAQFGPQPAPDDYRIANRPGNPNWKGVKDWFDKAAE